MSRSDPHAKPEKTDPASPSHWSFIVAEILFSVSATLSFILVYADIVEMATRMAVRSTYLDLPGPILGCVLFFNGLLQCFTKPRSEPVWDPCLKLMFLLGWAATASGLLFPALWR